MMKVPPTPPKVSITGSSMQEPCNLIYVADRHRPVQQMTKRVKRGVSKGVLFTKGGETERLEAPHDAPFPEIFETWRTEACADVIPQPVMQIDRDWDLGIEIVSLPLPMILSRHRGKVIAGTVVKAAQRFVAQGAQRFLCCIHRP